MAGYGVKNGMVSVTFLVSMLYNCDARVYLTAQRLSFGGTKHYFFCTPKNLVRTGTNRTATLRRTCTCDRKLPPILKSLSNSEVQAILVEAQKNYIRRNQSYFSAKESQRLHP